jgi:peroxiredoxin (alkyl hydroperoxide reductase subunit C)
MTETDTPPAPVMMARLDEPAPDFTQESTAGPLSLKSFGGKWFVLFSHPADFTPVCTTEFIGLAELA